MININIFPLHILILKIYSNHSHKSSTYTRLTAVLRINTGYDINDLFREALTRWLKPAEVLFILQNHDKYQLTEEPPQQPTSNVYAYLDILSGF